MRRLAVKSCLTDEGLKAVMESQKTIRRFKDYQIIYSVQTNYGKKAEEIASMLGVKQSEGIKNGRAIQQERHRMGKEASMGRQARAAVYDDAGRRSVKRSPYHLSTNKGQIRGAVGAQRIAGLCMGFNEAASVAKESSCTGSSARGSGGAGSL